MLTLGQDSVGVYVARGDASVVYRCDSVEQALASLGAGWLQTLHAARSRLTVDCQDGARITVYDTWGARLMLRVTCDTLDAALRACEALYEV